MAGTSFEQRRGTAAQWRTANPVLKDGEIGYEKDTHVIKIGDGVNNWNALPSALDQTYLPTQGKAADADKLDGHDSSEFLLKTEATSTYLSQVNAGTTYVSATSAVSANTPNAVVRRDTNGAFAVGAITGLTTPASDDAAANRKFVNDSLTSFGRDRGSGASLPTTDLRRGDTYYWVAIAAMMAYTGVGWRQVPEGSGVVATFATLPTPLYDGFQVFVTSRNCMYRVWNLSGTLTWKMAQPYCRLVLPTDVAITAGGNFPLTVLSKDPTYNGLDPDNMAPNAGSTNQFIVVAVPGNYDIHTVMHFTGVGNTFNATRIIKNATAGSGSSVANSIAMDDRILDSSNEATMNVTALGVPLIAGDKISVENYTQATSGAIRRAATFTNNNMYTRLILEYRGPIPQTGT